MDKKAQDDQLGEGSRLLKAVRESEAELPGIGRYTASLDQAYQPVPSLLEGAGPSSGSKSQRHEPANRPSCS